MRNDPGRSFVDACIFGYVYSQDDPNKQHAAKRLIFDLSRRGLFVTSEQAIREFASFAIRGRIRLHDGSRNQKDGKPDIDDLLAVIENLYAFGDIGYPEPGDLRVAIHAVYRYQFGFYDAFHWIVARRMGCRTFYTEDLPSQPVIEGVEYINPFPSRSDDG